MFPFSCKEPPSWLFFPHLAPKSTSRQQQIFPVPPCLLGQLISSSSYLLLSTTGSICPSSCSHSNSATFPCTDYSSGRTVSSDAPTPDVIHQCNSQKSCPLLARCFEFYSALGDGCVCVHKRMPGFDLILFKLIFKSVFCKFYAPIYLTTKGLPISKGLSSQAIFRPQVYFVQFIRSSYLRW